MNILEYFINILYFKENLTKSLYTIFTYTDIRRVRMLKLYCNKCNYKFEKEKKVSRCPYCASEDSIKKQMTAQDILNEVAAEERIIEDSMAERLV